MSAEPSSAVSQRARPQRKRAVLLVLLALFIGGVASLWLARHWLGEKAATTMQARLAERGVFVSWESAALLPGFGISFEGLKWYREGGQKGLLLAWDEAQVKRGRAGWRSAWVQANGSTLQAGEGDAALRLEDLDLEVHVDREGLEVKELLGRLGGLQIELDGQVVFQRLKRVRTSGDVEVVDSQEPQTKAAEAVPDMLEAALARLRDWLPERVDETMPPVLSATVSAPESESGHHLHLELDSGPLRWRGQDLPGLAATADWPVRPGRREPVRLTRLTTTPDVPGQKMDASVDLDQRVVSIAEADVVLHAHPVVLAVAPKAQRFLSRLRLAGPVRVWAQGEIPWKNANAMQLAGHLSAPGTTNITIGDADRTLPLVDASIAFHHSGGEWRFAQSSAGLWGGRLMLEDTRLEPAQRGWQTRMARLDGAQVPQMLHSFGKQAEQQGELYASWSGGGGFSLASLRGGGDLTVTRAAFYRIPLLGPLHLIFDRLAPGFARDTATELRMRHQMAGGILQVRQARVQSAITEIQVDGALDLNRRYADLTARAQLRGIAGIPTALLGMLLTLDGEGSFDNIEWRLRYTPGLETITGIAGTVGGTVLVVGGTAGGVVREVGGTAVDTAADAVKGAGKAAGEAVKGILNLPGRLFGR